MAFWGSQPISWPIRDHCPKTKQTQPQPCLDHYHFSFSVSCSCILSLKQRRVNLLKLLFHCFVRYNNYTTSLTWHAFTFQHSTVASLQSLPLDCKTGPLCLSLLSSWITFQCGRNLHILQSQHSMLPHYHPAVIRGASSQVCNHVKMAAKYLVKR